MASDPQIMVFAPCPMAVAHVSTCQRAAATAHGTKSRKAERSERPMLLIGDIPAIREWPLHGQNPLHGTPQHVDRSHPWDRGPNFDLPSGRWP